MSAFEILLPHYIETTTSVALTSFASTNQSYLFLRNDPRRQIVSSTGTDTSTSQVTVRLNFNQTLNVSRIALTNTNGRAFTIFFNGLTANTFSLTGAATTISNYSTNSETSMYWECATAACTSVSIDISNTIVLSNFKALGYFYIGDILSVFDRLPSADNYTPMLTPHGVTHTLSDGSTRTHVVSEKWSAEIDYDYISASFRNELRTVYDRYDHFVFVPFGTSTAWDGIIFPAYWDGPFTGYKFSDNSPDSGFSLNISLKEGAL